ncbi:MAG: hypothetical protein HYS63_07215 [Methylocystis sp.]|nr:hypothetical protein [Methylocystis sp.]
MHLFEYALRDFMNTERRCAPGAVIVLDDIFPNHPAQAERERRTRVWTGDVWRLTEALRRRRPDLFLMTLDASPAGLLLVAGLDRENRVLQDNYTEIVRQGLARSGPPDTVLERRDAVDPCSERFSRTLAALKRLRANGVAPRETARRLRKA